VERSDEAVSNRLIPWWEIASLAASDILGNCLLRRLKAPTFGALPPVHRARNDSIHEL